MTTIDPRFRLADPEVTRRLLVKHLVCACTGLPRQDFEWLFTFDRSSPQGQLDVLATMKPTDRIRRALPVQQSAAPPRRATSARAW